MSLCLFDLLPVELVHIIFTYLLANDIFYTFLNLSPYLDSIIANYDRYHLNFKASRKSHFDLVCRHIRPHQVLSLTLSDDNDTPDQSKLFFSFFKGIENFVRLRSLRLIKIDIKSLQQLSLGLNQLECLSSLEFTQQHSVSEQFNNAVAQLFPQLNRLILYDARHLTVTTTSTQPLSHLRHLTLVESWFVHLQRISRLAPNLTSLNVTVHEEIAVWPLLSIEQMPPYSLTQFVLNIQHCPVTLDQMVLLLSNMSHLRHLELEARGNDDLCDGRRWEVLTSHLTIFNFKFKLNSGFVRDRQQALLSSFCTPFWLEQKRWFVACNQWDIYTVPRFAETSACESFHPPIHSTVLDEMLFYEHICTLALNKINEQLLLAHRHRFPQVKTLLLAKHISLDTLRSLVDLSKVEYLKVSLDKFVRLIDNMPRLHQLALSSLSLSGSQHASAIEQIRTLHINTIGLMTRADEKRLCHIFTRIERLYVHDGMKSRRQMARLIDGFHFLSYGLFEFEWGTTERVCETPEWLVENTRRLTNNNYTYRIDGRFVHLWIGDNDDEQHVSIDNT